MSSRRGVETEEEGEEPPEPGEGRRPIPGQQPGGRLRAGDLESGWEEVEGVVMEGVSQFLADLREDLFFTEIVVEVVVEEEVVDEEVVEGVVELSPSSWLI